MGKTFEEQFSELQVDMVKACYEYAGYEGIEKIYIYASCERGVKSVNFFYKTEGVVIREHLLNSFPNRKHQVSVKDSCIASYALMEDLEKIIKVCKEFNRDAPTEIKLIYDAEKGSLESNYKYDFQYANHPTLFADHIFEQWYEDMKALEEHQIIPERTEPYAPPETYETTENELGTGIVKGPGRDVVASIEKDWNIRFPESYIRFVSENNGLIPKASLFMCEGREYVIERFVCLVDYRVADGLMLEEYDIQFIASEYGNYFEREKDSDDMQLMPIVFLADEDYVCLDYRTDKQEPEICVWDHKRSKDLAPYTYKVADTFDDFLKMLYEPKD